MILTQSFNEGEKLKWFPDFSFIGQTSTMKGSCLMKETANQRQSMRYRSNPTLTFQFSMFSEKYRAKGSDHSEEGLSFESSYEIKPGTIVFIRRNECIQSGLRCEDCKGCKAITFATIKWCTKVKEMPAEKYRIGARYLYTQ